MSAEYLYESIKADVFSELKTNVDALYELPGAIVRSRMGSTYAWAALSVGKPWFDYLNPPDELLRIRSVERWRVDEETRELRAGVMKIVIQQAFNFSDARLQVNDSIGSNVNDSDELELLVSQRDTTLVMDASAPSIIRDVSFYKRFKICKFASGTSKSTPIHHYDTAEVVVGTDEERDYDGTVERFFKQEPVFELSNTYINPVEELQEIIKQLGEFTAMELELAKQRE